MYVTKASLIRDGKDVGFESERQGKTPTNPFTPGGWYHKDYQQGLDVGKQLAKLAPKAGPA